MALSTYVLGEPAPRDGWLISEWDQGFSPTEWQTDNVYEEGAATVFELNTRGHSDPYAGAEVQSSVTATTGTWAWHAKAPDMVPGTVFGLFLFQADWRHPRLEFDFEIVGDDPTTIELVTHMAMADGRKQTAVRKVKLDFDPSAGFNLYEILLDGSSATFRINGSVAATFDRQDFGGYWRTGEVRSYINLWVADAPGWAGLLDPNTLPIRAEISSAGWQPNQISWTGTAGADHFRSGPLADVLDGLSGADQLYGEAGSDQIYGGAGSDRIAGGDANDRLWGGSGNDWLDGGAGSDTMLGGLGNDTYVVGQSSDRIRETTSVTSKTDAGGWDSVRSGVSWTLGANLENLVLTGQANLSGTGNTLANQITGNKGVNILSGREGSDRLWGRDGNDKLRGDGGNDRIYGEAGSDSLYAGTGADKLYGGLGRDQLCGGIDSSGDAFVFTSRHDSAVGTNRDVIHNFNRGVDDIDLRGIDARPSSDLDDAFVWGGSTAGAYRLWWKTTDGGVLLRADVTGNATTDFEVFVKGVIALGLGDVLL